VIIEIFFLRLLEHLCKFFPKFAPKFFVFKRAEIANKIKFEIHSNNMWNKSCDGCGSCHMILVRRHVTEQILEFFFIRVKHLIQLIVNHRASWLIRQKHISWTNVHFKIISWNFLNSVFFKNKISKDSGWYWNSFLMTVTF